MSGRFDQYWRVSGPQAGSSSGLARVLGTGLLTVLVVGDILGAGIYILVGEVAAEVGGRLRLPFPLAQFLGPKLRRHMPFA